MYCKICPEFRLSSFSPDESLDWSCLYCGKELTAMGTILIRERKTFNIRPGGPYCALCSLGLFRLRDDLLVCIVWSHGYKEHPVVVKVTDKAGHMARGRNIKGLLPAKP